MLIDTCVLLWLAAEPDNLSTLAKKVLDDPQNDLVVSHASVWELALQTSAGKLRLPAPLRSWLSVQRQEWQFNYLPMDLEHILRTQEIRRYHADPFDRIIISQAIVEGCAVVSPDAQSPRYPVHVIW